MVLKVVHFFVAAAVAMVAFAAPAIAQAPHIEYADVVSSGYSGAGEALRPGPFRRRVTHTPVRAVAVGTKFDMKVRLVGEPLAAEVPLRFVWRAPRPGVKDPKTGRLSRETSVDLTAKIGAEVERRFEFADQSQIVRGTWRAEVWNGKRRIAMRRFAVQ